MSKNLHEAGDFFLERGESRIGGGQVPLTTHSLQRLRSFDRRGDDDIADRSLKGVCRAL